MVIRRVALVEPSYARLRLDRNAGARAAERSSALRKHARTGCAALLLVVLQAPLLAATVQYEGRATDPESGRALYTERHLLREADGKPRERLVTYACPDGAAFARKRVDYSASLVAPSFQLDDGRDGYREGVRRAGGRIDAYVRDRNGEAERSGVLAASARLVADAGFDEYVRRNWTALTAGATLPVEFAVPASRRSYTFKLRRIDGPVIDGVPTHRFRLKVSGLLGLVAPQIDVAYAQKSRRLLRFEGVTNLRDPRGEQWTARIAFADRPAQAVDDALWAEALAAPLGVCAK